MFHCFLKRNQMEEKKISYLIISLVNQPKQQFITANKKANKRSNC